MANSNTGIIIGVVITVVVVAGVVIYVATRPKTPPKTKPAPTPIAPPTPAQAAASFPIQYGATGDLVKALQQGLNQYQGVSIAVDGLFGAATNAAVSTAGFTVPVSLADFDEITAPDYTEVTDPTTGLVSDVKPNATA